jgi:hypothetical protein
MTTDKPNGFTDQPPFPKCSGFVALALLVLVLVLPAVGCRSYPVAEESIKTGISVNAGHVKDESLPAEAVTIAEKNGDLLWKVLFSIGGCEEKDIPAEVVARQKARKGSTE